jgi:peptidoglycan LD-endopeptidase CwlK
VHTAPRIAELLKSEYAGLSYPGSYHLPGQSWHQWGEALDVYAVVGGKAIWEGSAARLIAEICKEVGLYHSYNEKVWEPKSRHWHVQLRKKETPMLIRGLADSWSEVEQEMLKRFEV